MSVLDNFLAPAATIIIPAVDSFASGKGARAFYGTVSVSYREIVVLRPLASWHYEQSLPGVDDRQKRAKNCPKCYHV